MKDLVAEVPERFLAAHELDRYIRLLNEYEKPKGYDPGLVALAALNNFTWLIRASVQGSKQAISWREYRVGAAVFAYNFEKPAMGITIGYNVKPFQNGQINLHAEQIALAKARALQLEYVVALAVWGDPHDINANAGQSPTLRPCKRCSKMFETEPMV